MKRDRILAAVALVAVLAGVAFAQGQTTTRQVSTLTYCEACAAHGFNLDFGDFSVSAGGLTDPDGDGTYTGPGFAQGALTGATDNAVRFTDNPYFPGRKWVASLSVTGKGFALVSTAYGPEPFPGEPPHVLEEIRAELLTGPPGQVRKSYRAER